MSNPSPSKQVHLNAFEMNCVGHLARGLWKHPANTRHRYTDADFWIEEAQLLEHGLFDTMFLADVLGTYETAPGDSDRSLRAAHQVPVNDPLLLVPMMAAAARQLAFSVTISATYEPLFAHARRISTVDHLTKGRIGWNVVTSYLDNAARNFGLDAQIRHDDRYDRAEEYLDVCYKLWEGSWDDGAVIRDVGRDVYSDPSKVHYIDHRGEHFAVPGPHLSEPSIQRTPVIFVATASGRGKLFAAKHAEAVFLGGSTIDQAAADIAEIRAQAEQFGRDRNDVKVFTHLRVVTGRTESEVQDKADDYARYRAVDGNFFGLDLAAYPADTLLSSVKVEPDGSGRDRAGLLQRLVDESGGNGTVGQLRERIRRDGGVDPFIMVGTPAQVVDRIEEWITETDLDGFNVHSHVTPESYLDFIDLIVPELQRRGLYRDKYDPDESTLRERLFGAGHRRLPDTHPAAAYRGAFGGGRERLGA
jgi:FMN-dependent oxidoreductase (nitrilotriacetate monooxygenase family)